MLSGLPAKVIKALSGEEALAQAGQGREFAAILLDVVMPGMDGFETAIRLRQLEALKRTPILFLTALEKDPKEITKAYHLGAVDYLIKPIVPEILRAKVEVFLQLFEVNWRSNRELQDFAYAAAHDLKAPLRAIDHLAQWIVEDVGEALPETSRADLAQLQQRVARMGQLLDSLLAYARVGQSQSETEVIDMEQLIQDILGLFEIPDAFTVTVDAALPTFQGPKASVELVLRNLIDNALKHHGRADGRIAISGRDLGHEVEWVVADDGPGIPSVYHEKIFQIFQTLEPRDQVEGSGMGLALVKKTVEHYGGTLVVESEKNQGARFIVTWPKPDTRRT